MSQTPLKGDIYWVTFEPARGVEQAGRRPALVVQNDRGNRTAAYTVVVAITGQPLRTRFPFTVPVDAGEGGLARRGYINCSQVLTVDKTRLGDYIGALSSDRMDEVDAALRYEFDL